MEDPHKFEFEIFGVKCSSTGWGIIAAWTFALACLGVAVFATLNGLSVWK